jgi:type I restriction enzyme S subunit
MKSRKIQIKDVCQLNASTISKRDSKSSILYLDTGSLTRNKITNLQSLNIGVDTIPSRAQRKVKDGTILYSVVRPLQEHFGIIRNPPENLIASTGFTTIDVIDVDVNDQFLFYCLTQKSTTEFLHGIAVNNVSSYPSLNPDDIGNLIFEIPSEINDQIKLSEILLDIEKKIEINERVNLEIEQLLKLVFNFWFTQFDFEDSNGMPYKASGGEMVWSEILNRDIPIQWNVGSLSDISTILGGSTPSKDDQSNFDSSGMPWITPKDLSLNETKKFVSRGEVSLSQKGFNESSLKLMPKGSVLLSSRAPIGYMAIASNNLTTNQGFKTFLPDKGYSTSFIYYAIKSSMPTILNYASGSTFKEISGSVLKDISICLPPKAVADKFTTLALPYFELQQHLEDESQALESMRAWLLPLITNGHISVQ